MVLLVESQAECEELLKKIKELGGALLSGVGPERTRKMHPATSDLSKEHWGEGKLYVLQEGAVRFTMQGKLFMLYEEGDFLGLDIQRNIQGAEYSSDFAIQVEEFSRDEFLRIILANSQLSKMWLEYLNLQAKLFLVLSGHLLKTGFQPETSIEQFGKGHVIIKQGSQGKEVFTLVEGAADVLVDGVKVGEIGANQIFGALAAMTNTPRSASVVAREACTVVSLTEDHFIDLIKSRPETVMHLCKDMAETIIGLNHRVVEGKKIKQ